MGHLRRRPQVRLTIIGITATVLLAVKRIAYDFLHEHMQRIRPALNGLLFISYLDKAASQRPARAGLFGYGFQMLRKYLRSY